MSPSYERRSGGPSREGRPGSGGGRSAGGRRENGRSSGNRSYGNRSSGNRPFSNRFSENGSGNRRSRTARSEINRPSNARNSKQRLAQDRSPAIRGRNGERPSSDEWGRSGRTHDERPRNNRRIGGPDRSNRTPDHDRFTPRGGTAEASPAKPVADDLIWGRHATQAALETGRPIHRIWCTPELRSATKFLQLLREAKACGVLVEEVSWARLGQITGGSVHQGIALQTAATETLDLGTLIEGCADLGESPLLLALDGVTDPQNLGAVVRSAEAMGAHGVVLPQRRSAGLTGSVAKVAAGALEHLPVARVVNLNRSLETLKDAGYRVVGLAAEGDVTITDVDFSGPLVLVTGSEDQGLSLLTRRHCDQLVRIPLRGITPSLNASVATALCVYEVARRNWMKDIHGQAPSPPLVRPRKAEPEIPAERLQPSRGNAEQAVEIRLTAAAPERSLHFDESIQLSP